MTKQDAVKALAEGKKVRHEYFTSDEWMMEVDGFYQFEDGVSCLPAAFWIDRMKEEWNSGWSIVPETETDKLIFRAIVLIDEPGDPSRHYASLVYQRIKRIETRMRNIIPEGDIVICCGSKSMTTHRLKALCIVNVGKARPMTKEDERLACIECVPNRIAYDLSDWRYFSRKFEFAPQYVDGSFQGIFRISIPKGVTILKFSMHE